MAIISTKNRTISVLTLIMINIIAIDSLRNLPINAVYGFSIPFYYIVCCLFFLIPCALITAELATHYPKTGGAYIWVKQAFGPRVGFVAIWVQWIYNVFWYPTILAFVAANVAYLIDPSLIQNKTYMISMIMGLFLVATIVNSFGMRTSGIVSILSAIIGTIIPMTVIIIMGSIWVTHNHPLAITPTVPSFFPNLSNLHNIAIIVAILFSIFGLEMSATHAESVKNPEKDYPKALLYSSIFIVLSLILATLAIAVVVPQAQLNMISGLDQAFELFLKAYHLSYLLPIIVLAIIIGSFGSISAWVIGPTKGLMVAAEDGLLPKVFKYKNRKESPIIILILQAALVMLICSLFVFIKNFTTSYWILTDLTSLLAIVFYLLFFSAGWKLHRITPRKPGAFRLKDWAMRLACIFGLLISLFALGVGFIPPTSVQIDHLVSYELILFLGLGFFTLLPFWIASLNKKR